MNEYCDYETIKRLGIKEIKGLFYDVGEDWIDYDIKLIIRLLSSIAKDSIILFDSYVDTNTLHLFKDRFDGTHLTIVTSPSTHLSNEDITFVNGRFDEIDIVIKNKSLGATYLVIDDFYCFRLNTSISKLDNTKKYKTFVEFRDTFVIDGLKKYMTSE